MKVDFVIKSDEKCINMFIAPAGYIFRPVEANKVVNVKKPKLIDADEVKLLG